MSSTDTKQQIEQAVSRLQQELPALGELQLVVRLELRGRGDAQVWRVEVPGPKLDKDPAGDARIHITIPRSNFNELASEGRLNNWVDAFERGHIKVSGDQSVVSLLGKVIERRMARTG